MLQSCINPTRKRGEMRFILACRFDVARLPVPKGRHRVACGVSHRKSPKIAQAPEGRHWSGAPRDVALSGLGVCNGKTCGLRHRLHVVAAPRLRKAQHQNLCVGLVRSLMLNNNKKSFRLVPGLNRLVGPLPCFGSKINITKTLENKQLKSWTTSRGGR